MRARKVRAPMECACCGEHFDSEDAEVAEQHGVTPYDGELFRCDECGECYTDRDEAKECCR